MFYMVVDSEDKMEWFEQEEELNLKQLYQLIECRLIEVVQLRGVALTAKDGTLIEDPLVILDEEGKLTGRQINPIATNLFRIAGINDTAVGTVVICDQGLLN